MFEFSGSSCISFSFAGLFQLVLPTEAKPFFVIRMTVSEILRVSLPNYETIYLLSDTEPMFE